MSLRFAVFAHEPLTGSGWKEIEQDVSPDEAANLARAWGAKGWRVLVISVECIEEGWVINWPALDED